MTEIVPGMVIYSSNPTTYTVQYLNGSRTYTEQFAIISFSVEYVAAFGAAVTPLVQGAASALAAIPLVGPALAGFVELAVSWYASASLDADGSIALLLAPHFCGTKAGGVDLTAWPLPGVDAGGWWHVVQAFIAASHMAAVEAIDGVAVAASSGTSLNCRPAADAAASRQTSEASAALHRWEAVRDPDWRVRLAIDLVRAPAA